MPASRSTILRWLNKAKEQGATHLVIRCDQFDYSGDPSDGCCYPVFVMPNEAPDEQRVRERAYGSGEDRLMEVYSLTGLHSIEDQMRERRAFHYD